jgi:hypothetical protein
MGQSYKKIVILYVLRLIKVYESYFSIILFFIVFTSSCNTNNIKVPESDIISASNWSENDQFPTFSECENLIINEQINCFTNTIEYDMNNYLIDKIFPIDNTEYILTIIIDSEGNFNLLQVTPNENLDEDLISILKQAVENIRQALPAIKTNVGEFVEVKFDLPFKLNYD